MKGDQFHFKEPTVVVCFDTTIELQVDNGDESEQRSWTVEPTVDPMTVSVSTVYRSSNIVFASIQLEKREIDRWSNKYGEIPTFKFQASLKENKVCDLSQKLILKSEDKFLKSFILKVNAHEIASFRGK